MAPTVRALSARAFARDETALIKATSFVSEIAPLLVPENGRAAFIYVGARSYIETILAGENSVQELRALGGFRAQRMRGRLPNLSLPDDAHRAAAGWACEMTALESAAAAMSGRPILWVNFDDFLARPVQLLMTMADHFRLEATSAEIDRIATGPLLRRYSKDLDYEYSPQLRQELQAEARQMHEAAIESALAMLDEASRASSLLSQALDRSAGRE
jgi:hypothetical protein